MTAKFWMVIDISQIEPDPYGEVIPRKKAPTFLHQTRESAVKEMFRLQQKDQIGEFVVLEAVSTSLRRTTTVYFEEEIKL